LIKKDVTLTSTLTVFETYTENRPKAYPKALDTLIPRVREQYEASWGELMVEAGFSVEEAIEIYTLNGAKYLHCENLIDSIETGKRTNLVLVDSDLSKYSSAIRDISVVFKGGIGYDIEKKMATTKSVIGLH
jgi:enamidase